MAINPLTGQFIPGTQAQGAPLGGIQPAQTAFNSVSQQPQQQALDPNRLLQGQSGPVVDIFANTLGRAPDAAGLEFWRKALQSGVPIAQIQQEIANSPEAKGTRGVPVPPSGLLGSEMALSQSQEQSGAAFNQAAAGFDPFLQQGQGAADVQAALSGALGPQAQTQALANLQPVSSFLQDRGEQAIARNAARLGGLGGGNVRKELVQFGQGLAGESAQQQFQNLGTVAGRGLNAAQGLGNIRQNQAQQFGQFGIQRAAGRTRAGEQIGAAIGGTTSALAQLQAQQGAGVSDVIGGTTGNLANLLAGAGQQAGGANEQLATLLANLATQQASQTAGLPGVPGTQQSGGILGGIGQAAGGVGTLLGAL